MIFTAGTLVLSTFAISTYGIPWLRRRRDSRPLVLWKTRDGRVNRLLQFGVKQPFRWVPALRGRRPADAGPHPDRFPWVPGVRRLRRISLKTRLRVMVMSHVVNFAVGSSERRISNTDKYLLPDVLRVRRAA